MYIYILLIVLLLLVGLAFLLIVWIVPRRQVHLLQNRLEEFKASDPDKSQSLEKYEAILQYKKDLIALQLNVLSAETSARTTLAQIVGGVLVLFGLAATSLNLVATYNSSQSKAADDRFAIALSRLPDRDFAVRMGGVYEINAVDREFPRYHDTTLEIIAAFVRSKSGEDECKDKKEPNPEQKGSMKCIDVQAALSILAGRNPSKDRQNWFLDLRELHASGAELDRASFENARLSFAEIIYSSLINSDLKGADLTDGEFTFTDFTGSHFEDADLRRARFRGAVLKDVYFSTKTKLDQANFENAKLKCAHLGGVDLSVVQGDLTWEQVREADFDEKTIFPSGVLMDKALSNEKRIPCGEHTGRQ